jgi:hypothetical protein
MRNGQLAVLKSAFASEADNDHVADGEIMAKFHLVPVVASGV